MFWIYAGLTGLSLSYVLLAFTGVSVVRTFLVTAASFGALSLYGYTTKRDLSGLGSFLFMGLVGIILASVVNFFLQSSALHFAVSVIGVLIFAGLTAYDTQDIKRIYYAAIRAKWPRRKPFWGRCACISISSICSCSCCNLWAIATRNLVRVKKARP